MIWPALLIFAAGAAIIAFAFTKPERDVPQHDPDAPPTPGTTGYKRVDAILGELQKAAQSSGIPLGLLVGWIAKESGGRLDEVTKLDERGLFQLMPAESKSLGLDHDRLSTDLTYSINAGLLLIGKYMQEADRLGIAPKGSNYYWRLVKLLHTMGTGAVQKIVAAAGDATKSWDTLESFALAHDSELASATKHHPAKWFPLVDSVYRVGTPFGFGSATTLVGASFPDIVDPLDCLT